MAVAGGQKCFVVVASSYQQFKDWCKDNGVDGKREAIYANEVDKITGLDETLVSEVVELVDDHEIQEHHKFWNLKKRVQQWRETPVWTNLM